MRERVCMTKQVSETECVLGESESLRVGVKDCECLCGSE